MATLFSKFVAHYTGASLRGTFRQHYSNSWGSINRNDEVQAIQDYLLKPTVGVDFLNTHVATAASNAEFVVKFASIFCHKKPKVTPVGQPSPPVSGQTVSCELGDLFVLFVLIDGAHNVHHARGALFQAKVEPKLDRPTQKFLYDKAESIGVPSYLEKRNGSSSNMRQLPTYDEGRAHGFRYLILKEPIRDATGKSSFEVGTYFCPWESTYWTRWASFMDGLLSGNTGLSVDVNSPSSAWDHIVADLFEMVKFTAGQKKPARGNTVVAEITSSCFNNYRDRSQFSMLLEDEKRGVPTLLVIAHAPEIR